MALTSVAVARPSFVLIDEPELNLHPSLQTDFLTTIGAYAKAGVLFATHNIGLARSSADRIYTCRLESGVSIVRPYDSDSSLSETLGELNFAGYRALGYDVVLLIEGRTDVKTIQQFLRLRKLDHKVVVVPLGGGEMIHGSAEDELRELCRLSDKIFAIIDSEKTQEAEPLDDRRVAFAAACRRLGIDCRVTTRRALENYLTDLAVKLAFGPSARALTEFEDPRSTSWPKRSNWKAARHMSLEDVEGTDLGTLLQDLERAVGV